VYADTEMKHFIACLLFASAVWAESPSEAGIRQAEAEIAKSPDHYPYYNALAMAYTQRAGERSDGLYYDKAEATLAKSFSIAPNNLEGLKVRTRILLGRHDFAKALELATKLNRQTPDDIEVYAELVEANAELGNYQEAVAAAEWMLKIRPGNAAGLASAGYLRELYGYIAPAIEVTRMALDSTSSQDSDQRAKLLVRLAHLDLMAGDSASAEIDATGALALLPEYPAGLGALAEVRLAQRRYDDAVSLLQKRYDEAPRAANLFALGNALELAGRKADAGRVFVEFERTALAESNLKDNADRELISYYVDRANKPALALRLAEQEIAVRHDVFTLDSYAWALAANGNTERASVEIHKALAIGVKDPTILRHADAIQHRLRANGAPGNMGE